MTDTKPKRYRRRDAKPGQLIAYYGKLPHDNPDIVYAWGGEGVGKRHGSMLHCLFGTSRLELVWCDDQIKNGGRPYKFGKSMLEMLDEAGFDLTTLKFSIELKQTTPTSRKDSDHE